MTLYERLDLLEARVFELETMLGLSQDEDRRHALQRKYRLYPGESAVLLTLYAARGRVVLNHRLFEVANGLETNKYDSVKVRISQIRRKLHLGAIETRVGVGYLLTPLGIEKCEAAWAA